MTAKAIHKKLTEQRKDLEALRSDLPKVEGLLEQHRQAADKAKRAGAPSMSKLPSVVVWTGSRVF